MYGYSYTQCDDPFHGKFSLKSSQNTPHSLPMRVRYGRSFVRSTSVVAVLYKI